MAISHVVANIRRDAIEAKRIAILNHHAGITSKMLAIASGSGHVAGTMQKTINNMRNQKHRELIATNIDYRLQFRKMNADCTSEKSPAAQLFVKPRSK